MLKRTKKTHMSKHIAVTVRSIVDFFIPKTLLFTQGLLTNGKHLFSAGGCERSERGARRRQVLCHEAERGAPPKRGHPSFFSLFFPDFSATFSAVSSALSCC